MSRIAPAKPVACRLRSDVWLRNAFQAAEVKKGIKTVMATGVPAGKYWPVRGKSAAEVYLATGERDGHHACSQRTEEVKPWESRLRRTSWPPASIAHTSSSSDYDSLVQQPVEG